MEIFIEEYVMYLRKSRSDGEKVPIEEILKRHENSLQEYAKNNLGFAIKEKNIYREVVSGGEDIEARPEFMKVLKRLEVGNVKGVLVIDPQRLSRSGIYGAGEVLEIFEITNTLIVTPVKTYDLQNKIDKKYLEMQMIQSAEYLDYTKEVLSRGRKTSVAEGKYIGSTAPFGYNKEKLINEKGYKLIINKEEAEIVKLMFDFILDGVGTSNIANYLNKEMVTPRLADMWTPQMVRSILKNPTYYGMLTWEKRKQVKKIVDGKIIKTRPVNEECILVKGLHEPIISKEIFETVQEKLKSNAPHTTRNSEVKNALAGIVVCGFCKHTMVRRPYNKSFRKNEVRKYDFSKEELLKLLRKHKEESKLSFKEIADALEVSKDIAFSWFPPKIEKFYPSRKFSDKWFEIKKLLNIKTKKFDKAITTYEKPHVQSDTLMCSVPYCKNVSTQLDIVEDGVLEALQEHLKNFNYYLDNYAEEIKKEVKTAEITRNKIDKKIDKLNFQMKRAKEFYELGDYTREEFLERKQEITIELEKLNADKEKLKDNNEENKIVKYKKAVPKIQHCLSEYPKLTIPEKNEILKSIIEKIEYKKTNKNGRWNKSAIDDFELKIILKI